MNNLRPSPIATASRGSSCESIPRVSPLPDEMEHYLNTQNCDMSIDNLSAMIRQERDYTPASFAQRRAGRTYERIPPSNAPGLPIMYPEWRSKICDWSYRVVDHFRYDREVVGVAMNLFDRYSAILKANEGARIGNNKGGTITTSMMSLEDVQDTDHQQDTDAAVSSTSPRSIKACYSEDSLSSLTSEEEEESKQYQLGAMTALFLSIKLHAESGADFEDHYSHLGHPSRGRPGGRRKKRRLKLLSFVELSRGQFEPSDISDMETTMLSALKWRVNPPTPTSFVGYFLKLLPTFNIVQRELVMHVLHELSRYLTELSVCLADVCTLYRPSWIAYSAILLSMETIRADVLPLEHRAAFVEAASRLSSHGEAGQVLSPTCSAVNYLMGRIRTSFLPEMLLDASSCPSSADGSQVSGDTRQGHPIAIARDADLLNLDVLRGMSSDMDAMTLTPSPSDDEDSGHQAIKCTWGRIDSVHRRDQSANSVMDPVNPWEATLHRHHS